MPAQAGIHAGSEWTPSSRLPRPPDVAAQCGPLRTCPDFAGVTAVGRIDHITSSFGRLRSQMETNIRVTVTAVKTEVTMPIISTTAKPRTGPEPK